MAGKSSFLGLKWRKVIWISSWFLHRPLDGKRLAPARGFDGPHGALPAALHARAAAGARALPPSLSIGGRELNGITMNIII